MGVIKDIVDKVAPIVQERAAKEGIGIKKALYEEFEKLGYIHKDKEITMNNNTLKKRRGK